MRYFRWVALPLLILPLSLSTGCATLTKAKEKVTKQLCKIVPCEQHFDGDGDGYGGGSPEVPKVIVDDVGPLDE